jgi:hypothetical protein
MNDTPAKRPFGHLLHVLLTIAIYWVVAASLQRLAYPTATAFSVWGLQTALAATAVFVAALAVGTLCTRQASSLGGLVTGVFLIASVIMVIDNLAVQVWLGSPQSYAEWLRRMIVLEIPAAIFILWFLYGPPQAAFPTRWRGLPVLVCYGLSQWIVFSYLPSGPFFTASADEIYESYTTVDIESLYHAQPALMQGQIDGLAPQQPGKPEMFGLLLGGSSYQSVFISEVEKGRAVLEQVYDAPRHFLQLANSEDEPQRFPMANRANLETALQALARHVGPEDVLFLYLTSHGSNDLFSLSFYEAGTTDLLAADFAAMLDRAAIGPAVIVLSACHSGSFIDELARPDRLILTAAAADRTSFGCRDGNEWTDFGQAFMAESLILQADPRQAFARAQKVIKQREFWQMLRHSLPQSSEGAEFAAALAPVLTALPAD